MLLYVDGKQGTRLLILSSLAISCKEGHLLSCESDWINLYLKEIYLTITFNWIQIDSIVGYNV